jgi:hypothetical protein
MSRGWSERALGILLAGILLQTACTRATASPPGEPTGGTWRPILLPSPDAIRLPPPPAAGSAEEKREVEELLALARPESRTEQAQRSLEQWNSGASLRWNEITRQLVAKHRQSHPMASRTYALLSVAQYDALVAVWNNKYHYRRRPPHQVASSLAVLGPPPADPSYPSAPAAVAAASAAVLSDLFPGEAASLARTAAEHQQATLLAGASFRSDVAAGDALGRQVAEVVIEHARNDGSDAGDGDGDGKAATGLPGGWVSGPNEEPIDPQWSRVRPWLLSSAAQFRAPPPPPERSAAFRAAVAEVRHFSETRTDAQARLAALWADGRGSYAPAGRWNKMAADLVLKYGLNELRAARVFALLNMALMDAGISAWDTKYHYATKRPTQFDPAITTPVREPNSPSYTCSHAAFSGAGSEVLGHLFPEERAAVRARAEEAAMSRVYGGIQFRFEGEAGLAEGRAVAELALERARRDGAP